MEISKGLLKHMDTIFDMYQLAKKDLQKQEIYQWDQYDPDYDTVEQDLKEGNLFVAKDDEMIVGSIVLDEKIEPEQEEMDWFVKEEPILYLHRLVVHPASQGKGVGRSLMEFAEHYALDYGYAGIRLDAYEENEIAQKLYKQLGYQRVGEIYYPRRSTPFIAYEKPLVHSQE